MNSATTSETIPEVPAWQADVQAVKAAAAGYATIKIGILTPLSPPGDPMAGTLAVRSARLGAEYLAMRGGVRGGKRIEFVVQNDQATAAEEGMQRSAVAGLAKLTMVDQVLAVVGQWHLRSAPVVVETANRLGVPIFIENGLNEVTRMRHNTTFRTYMSITDRVPLMLDFMRELGVRKVGILAANTVFGLQIADVLQAVSASHGYGFEFLCRVFDQETAQDFAAPLREIRDFGPDIFINNAVVRTNYQVIHQAWDVGITPSTPSMACFPYPMRSDDFWRLAGERGNYLVWPATSYRPSWGGLTEIGRWFSTHYKQRYGSFPPDNALNAFTDVTVIGQALDQARDETREALIEALESGTFETWRGSLRFTRGPQDWHHSPPPIMLMQYQRVGQSFDDAAIVYPDAVRTGEFVRPPSA